MNAKRFTAALGCAAVAALLGTACSPSASTHSAPSATQSAIPVITSAPAAAPPPAPTFSPEQQQALDSAEGYLSDGQGFSKAGLMKQLTSSYGEDFSPKLARFALNHLQVNWNQQAVLSAKGYVSSGQGYSYAGLVQQLESPYGEDFTPAQAQHGASAALR
jgi:hypothetical protein